MVEGILTNFANMLGLTVNISKSRTFFSVTTRRSKIESMVATTRIRQTFSHEKYLGFPIVHGRLTKSDYEFLIDKIQRRLASWKNKLLNKAGRLALVQSVLTSIPSYYMQIAWLPSSICDHIDKYARSYLWRGNKDKGVHLVEKDKITRPQKSWGFGYSKGSRIIRLCWES